jgi:hypothetical protein
MNFSAWAGMNGVSVTFMKKRELMQDDSWESRPLSVKDAVGNVSKYSAVWCSQLLPWYNPKAWGDIRNNRRGILMLRTFAGNNTYIGENNSVVYDYISEYHPEWFLLRDVKDPKKADPGEPMNRIRWAADDEENPYYNRFFFDIGNEELRDWLASYVCDKIASGVEDGAGSPYDGIAMDNVLLDAWCRRITREYPNWKYASNPQRWVSAYIDYLKIVKEKLNVHGYVLVVNQTLDYSSGNNPKWWRKLEANVDGMMDENAFAVPYYSGERWRTAMDHHDRIQEKGLIDWWLAYPTETEDRAYEDFLFAYTSYLLAKKSDRAYFYATRGERGYQNPNAPWYDEYDIELGMPLCTRVKSGACWIREFMNATVVINPTANRQQVSLEKGVRYYNYLERLDVVDVLSLAPQTGRILLKKQED